VILLPVDQNAQHGEEFGESLNLVQDDQSGQRRQRKLGVLEPG